MVREGLSPYAILALLVLKKYQSMRMYVDSSAVNKITIKYRHLIPRLKDMFDELYSSRVFSGGSKKWIPSDRDKRGG